MNPEVSAEVASANVAPWFVQGEPIRLHASVARLAYASRRYPKPPVAQSAEQVWTKLREAFLFKADIAGSDAALRAP